MIPYDDTILVQTYRSLNNKEDKIFILERLVEYRNFGAFEKIIKSIPWYSKWWNNNIFGPILHTAIRNDQYNFIKLLIAENLNLNYTDEQGFNGFHLAIKLNKLPIVLLLLQSNIALKQKDMDNCTVLHMAVATGNIKMIKLMFEQRITFEPDAWGNTPLHYAACKDNPDVIQCLLENGADINYKNTNGETPLHIAALFGLEENVRMLLHNGALFLKDMYEQTPFDLAATWGFTLIAIKLKDHYNLVKGHKLLNLSILYLPQIVEELINANPHIEIDLTGRTTYHVAAQSGNVGIYELVSQGIGEREYINAQDQNGTTPLHLAVREGYLKMVEMLIRDGADVNMKDKFGVSSLELARKYNYEDVAEFLVENGAVD